MDVKNIKTNGKGFYYCQTKDFATIKVRYYFNYEKTKENFVKALILNRFVFKANKVYKTEKQISNKVRELYNSSIYLNIKTIGIKSFIVYSLNMVDPRAIEKNHFSDSLNFYKDIVFNIDFTNEEVFNQIKKEILDNEKNILKNPSIVGSRLFFKSFFPNSDINYNNFTSVSELEDILDNISIKDISKFYDELFKNFVASLAFGNLLDEEIKQLEKTFKFKQIDFDYKYDLKDEIVNKDIEINCKETTQSNIYFVYEISDYDKEKSYVYDVLLTIMNNSNGPLNNIFRTKLGIVYSYSAQIYSNRGILYIRADIDKKNKDKAVQGLEEIFNVLHDEKEIEKLLKYTKDVFKNDLFISSESYNMEFNDLTKYALKYGKLLKEKESLINELKVKDIINQVDNLKYKCTYFFRGDKDA